jgi:hypothetical protein
MSKDGFIQFYFGEDINGSFELYYNPKLELFREIKTFDDDGYGENIRTCRDYDLSEEQEEAFNKQFPELNEEES